MKFQLEICCRKKVYGGHNPSQHLKEHAYLKPKTPTHVTINHRGMQMILVALHQILIKYVKFAKRNLIVNKDKTEEYNINRMN